MRFVVILFAALMQFPGCDHPAPTPAPPTPTPQPTPPAPPPTPPEPPPVSVIWPSTVLCDKPVSDPTVDQVSVILMADGTAELSEAEAAKLQALAASSGATGPAAIVCDIEALVDRWMAPTGSAASPENAAAAKRGERFLIERGVIVQVE